MASTSRTSAAVSTASPCGSGSRQDERPDGPGVDLAHQLHLVPLLPWLVLVDADRVDPQRARGFDGSRTLLSADWRLSVILMMPP